ncbi:MAG: HPr family phosphocarrier protein [Thiotrichales bacterium]
MISREVEVVNKLGLHARAAAKLVALASRFTSHIEIERAQRRVNGKSIMGVMMLAAAKGSSVSLHVDGDDEHDAIRALVELFQGRFGEAE